MAVKWAVLGLVIERPGYGYDLAQRLEERFDCWELAPSGVYSALEQLSSERLVRVGRSYHASGRGRSRVSYEATLAGINRFRTWILSSSPAPPLREELQMKVSLCCRQDVPRLIESVYGQELACMARVRELSHRDATIGAQGGDWPRSTRALAAELEIALWDSRLEWLRHARRLLEGLLERPGQRRPTGPFERALAPSREATVRAPAGRRVSVESTA